MKNAVCYYSRYSKQPLLHLCICGLQMLGHKYIACTGSTCDSLMSPPFRSFHTRSFKFTTHMHSCLTVAVKSLKIHFSGPLANFRKTASFVMSVYPSAWKNSAPTERIFVKFDEYISKICRQNSRFIKKGHE